MRCAVLALVACAAIVAGCGGSSGSGRGTCCDVGRATRPQTASLVLDFTPNAVHVGIYAALARRLDTRAGVDLHVEVPGASTDAISELQAGRVDFALVDIHDLAIARAKGIPLVGIMPIVQTPLASVIAAPAITRPRDLDGRTVGVTGAPSDTAVLDSIVAGDGGHPKALHTLDIGFNAVADVVAGRVSGATAFWNDEGVTLRDRVPGSHVFRVEDYGAPSYPELVLCTTRRSLDADPARATAVVSALRAGYRYAIAHPAQAAHDLESRVSGLDPALVSAQLPGLLRAFAGPHHRVGVFDVPLLHRWARWETRFGIVRRTPDVRAMFRGPPFS